MVRVEQSQVYPQRESSAVSDCVLVSDQWLRNMAATALEDTACFYLAADVFHLGKSPCRLVNGGIGEMCFP